MNKDRRTLLEWIWDFAKFAFAAFVTVIAVQELGGSDLLAGGLGAVIGIHFSNYFLPHNPTT